MTTDETLEAETADYKLGYEAGFEAGKEALKKEIEEGTRSGSVVYSLDSYSLLSDKEVRNLIAFVEEMAQLSKRTEAVNLANQRVAEFQEELTAALYSDAHSVLESVLSNTPDYKGVTPTAVTSFLTNNNEV